MINIYNNVFYIIPFGISLLFFIFSHQYGVPTGLYGFHHISFVYQYNVPDGTYRFLPYPIKNILFTLYKFKHIYI